jgi:hypothetical protein
MIEPNRAIVLGHQENGTWSDVWQFALIPQDDGTTRLLLRSRNSLEGLCLYHSPAKAGYLFSRLAAALNQPRNTPITILLGFINSFPPIEQPLTAVKLDPKMRVKIGSVDESR